MNRVIPRIRFAASELVEAWVGSENGNSKMNEGIKDSPISWKRA